jgi:elongation factor Ts
MVSVMLEKIKQLREKTGAGMMLCKEALEVSSGDENKAIIWLRQKGISIADNNSSRQTDEGIIGSYVHTGGKIGVLIEVLCETDFVARSDEFQELVKNVGMQIAACPSVKYISVDDVPSEIIEAETEIEAGKNDLLRKPEQIRAKIVEGRVSKRIGEMCLMSQPFVKDASLTVDEYIKTISGKLKENIKIARFTKFTR